MKAVIRDCPRYECCGGIVGIDAQGESVLCPDCRGYSLVAVRADTLDIHLESTGVDEQIYPSIAAARLAIESM